MRFTFQEGAQTIYQEIHSVTTNDYGLFVVELGQGIPSTGIFSDIQWENGDHYLKTEIDNGSGYVNLGTRPFQSVPYSLFAEKTNIKTGPGLSYSNDTLYFSGDVNPNDDILVGSSAGGDLNGTYPTPTVTGLQGAPVSTLSPADGEILKWDAAAGEWRPGIDLMLSGPGGVANVTARLTGDGSAAAPLDIAQQGATIGQILKWDGVKWVPQDDIGGTAYTEGPGIDISGNTIINTGDTVEIDDINIGDAATGDLSGTYPAPSVVRLRGNLISSQNPVVNQILKYNGSQWVPSDDEILDPDADPLNEIQTLNFNPATNQVSISSGNTITLPTLLAGAGISINNNIITNTGDTDPTNDITNTTPAGGDLGGIYPDPIVQKIQGFPVANTNPTTSSVFKWKNGQWIPDVDSVNDDDSNPFNEIQTLAIAGNTLSLSSGGGSVNLPNTTYVAGTGISITGNVISNIGDTDATDDITNTSLAGGDVTGTFSNLNVTGIQGHNFSNATPSTGDVFKWNGTEWEAGPDLNGYWTQNTDTLVYDGNTSLRNASGQARVVTGVDPGNNGFIHVYDQFNVLKAGIQIDGTGQGDIFGDVKNFRVPHPEDNDKEIWYASLEGPEAAAYVRGTAKLINGKVEIEFPEHFSDDLLHQRNDHYAHSSFSSIQRACCYSEK